MTLFEECSPLGRMARQVRLVGRRARQVRLVGRRARQVRLVGRQGGQVGTKHLQFRTRVSSRLEAAVGD